MFKEYHLSFKQLFWINLIDERLKTHEIWFSGTQKINQRNIIVSRDIFNALFVGADGIFENKRLHADIYQNMFASRSINSKNWGFSYATTSLSPSRIPKIAIRVWIRIYKGIWTLNRYKVLKLWKKGSAGKKAFGMHGTTADTFLDDGRRRGRRRDVTPYCVITAKNRGPWSRKIREKVSQLNGMDSRWRFAVGTVLTIRHQGRGINGGRDTGYLTSRSNVEDSTSSRSRTNRSTRSYRELGFPRKRSTRLLRSRLRLQATSIIHLTEHGPFKRDHGTSSKSQRSVKRHSRRANARTTGRSCTATRGQEDDLSQDRSRVA